MNEAQLEIAARHLCALRGIDPETLISHGAPASTAGFIPAILLYSPAWKMARVEIVAALHMQEAIAVGRAFVESI